MPLFKPMPFGKDKNGQLQEVICPRCKSPIEGEEVSSYGEGIGVRIVIGEYTCTCGYECKVEEHYPIINRALDTERHIP